MSDDSQDFDNVLSCLQSAQDNSTFLRALIDIRKCVDADWPQSSNNIEKLRVKGLRRIVSSLENPKKTSVNITLSILGNCCLEKRCAKDVLNQFGILSQLKHVLKRFPEDDSINGRVFRIVGNIIQHKDYHHATILLERKPCLVTYIVKYLKKMVEPDALKASEATVIMGLRSLRLLVNQSNLKALVLTFEVPKTVGLLLIKYGDIWLEKKECENILTNIVKCLQEYSEYRYYPCILEMMNTEKGDALVYLGKILPLAPKDIIGVVMNFSKFSQRKSDLPVSEIFKSLTEVLRNDKDDGDEQEFTSKHLEYMKCICRLLELPNNRTRESCGDSIALLTKILHHLDLQTSENIDYCKLIVITLNNCKFHDDLISEQLKADIANVLIDKLILIVDGMGPICFVHQNDNKRVLFRNKIIKRRRLSCYVENIFQREMREYRFIRNIYSPCSSNDSTSSTSSGTNPESFIHESSSDSDDYSPVCSEVDPADVTADPDEYKISDSECQCEDHVPTVPNQQNKASGTRKEHIIKLLIEILYLFPAYVNNKPPVPLKRSPDLLLRLTKCYTMLNRKTFPVLVVRHAIFKILSSHTNLLPLMQSDFISTIYDLSQPQHEPNCCKCKKYTDAAEEMLGQLVCSAESEVGKGDIAHRLLRGSRCIQERLALTIPYLIRNIKILKELVKCGALKILLKSLQEQSQPLDKCVKSLNILAKKFVTPDNKWSPGLRPISPYKKCSGPMVKFQLDDGSCLSANRELLSRQSDFFARLLHGDFKESMQDVIMLPDVESASLQLLLKLLTCKDVGCNNVGLKTYLNTISLCDRFLLENYRDFLASFVEMTQMTAKNIPSIYSWSLQSPTNLLRRECVTFALVGDITLSDRTKLFEKLIRLECNQEMVEDINERLEKGINCALRKYTQEMSATSFYYD